MKTADLLNYARDEWIAGTGQRADIASAIDGSLVATAGSGGLDFRGMLDHARSVGGPALRKLTFHERARIIKGLGLAILERKEELYELNYLTGATRKDGWIDIEGGAGTLLSFSSKGRRELPDAHVLLDGAVEPLSKSGAFIGQHIYSPMTGAAVHINAFNFPVWGMLEKLAPTLLAGMPAIVKPASSTAYLCEAAVRIMVDTGLLPEGALQRGVNVLANEGAAFRQGLDRAVEQDMGVGQFTPALRGEGEQSAGAALDVDPAVLAGGTGLIIQFVQLFLASHDGDAEALDDPRPLVERQLPQRRPAYGAGVGQHAAEIQAARASAGDRRAVDGAGDLAKAGGVSRHPLVAGVIEELLSLHLPTLEEYRRKRERR